MTTTTSSTREETIAILRAVLGSQRPHLALPNIAHRHEMTVRDLEEMLKHHGYPDRLKIAAAHRRMVQMGDAELEDEETTVDAAEPKRDPYVTALPVDALFTDPAYQRDLDPVRVAKMAREYDAALVGIVEVSARADGRYAVLDGQHRLAMTKDITFEQDTTAHIACRVHTGLSIEEEATLYGRLNTTRKQLNGWDRWKARRGAGETVCLAIEEACAKAGWTVSYRSGTRGHLTGTKALEKIHDLGGAPFITYILGIVSAAWNDDPDGAAAAIIGGLGGVVGAYGDDGLDRDRLIGALSGVLPRQILARAAAARELHKGTIDKLTAHVIVEEYNAAARGGKLPPFFSVRPSHSPNPGTRRRAEVERAAAIREWAIKRGLIRSETSHVTKAIREAYAAEHGGAELAAVRDRTAKATR